MESHFEKLNDRLSLSCKLYSLDRMLSGSSALKRKFSFSLEKPEIELYEILGIVNELKKIRKDFNSCVYIHQCTGDTYYVGYASGLYLKENVEKTDENIMLNRLADHRDNGGKIMQSTMTYLFPVISCLGFFPGDKEDEDLMTILMSKFAGNRIRGGKWASPYITPKYPDMDINEIKNKLLSRIFP